MTNPVVTNNDTSPLTVWNGDFFDVTLNAVGAVDYPAGQVLAFDATAGKWKKTVSGTPAVANAKSILAEDISFSGAGDKLVRAVRTGKIDDSQLVFDGTDTLDTIPAGADDSFRLQLRSYGIIAEYLAEQTFEDNQ